MRCLLSVVERVVDVRQVLLSKETRRHIPENVGDALFERSEAASTENLYLVWPLRSRLGHDGVKECCLTRSVWAYQVVDRRPTREAHWALRKHMSPTGHVKLYWQRALLGDLDTHCFPP